LFNPSYTKGEQTINLIKKSLFENQQLRFKDLKKITGVTSPTLSKCLFSLKKKKEVSRILSPSRNVFYYKLTDLNFMKAAFLVKALEDENNKIIKESFNNAGRPPHIMEITNKFSNIYGASLFAILSNHKKFGNHTLFILTELVSSAERAVKNIKEEISFNPHKGAKIILTQYEGIYRCNSINELISFINEKKKRKKVLDKSK
jgi:DNA-binding HxlR family transcriptional regulator|tara:strand:- start:495 stop:1103 length:609 start_codon:yes stop_codon:yes gene_type:complete